MNVAALRARKEDNFSVFPTVTSRLFANLLLLVGGAAVDVLDRREAAVSEPVLAM